LYADGDSGKKKLSDETVNKLQAVLIEGTRGRGISPLDLLKKYDKTGDGKLDKFEMLQIVRNDLGVPPGTIADEDVAALVAALDDDGSGTLSMHELADFIHR
jgi:hypothetical protein